MSIAVVLITGLLTGAAAYALTPWMRSVAGVTSSWLRPGANVVLAFVFGAGGAILADGWIELVAFAVLAVACSLLVAIDLATHRLPDIIVGPAYVALFLAFAASAGWTGSWSPLGRAALAGASVAIGFFLLALIAPAGLGLGDVKLAGLLGAFLGWLGWPQVLVGTAAAFVLNGVVVAVLLLARRVNLGSAVAFGPWLVVGAAVGAASQSF